MEHTIDLTHSSRYITIDGITYDAHKINQSQVKGHKLIALIEDKIEEYIWLLYEIDRRELIWVNAESGDAVIGKSPRGKGYTSLPLFFLITRDYEGDLCPDYEKIQNYVFGLFDCRAN